MDIRSQKVVHTLIKTKLLSLDQTRNRKPKWTFQINYSTKIYEGLDFFAANLFIYLLQQILITNSEVWLPFSLVEQAYITSKKRCSQNKYPVSPQRKYTERNKIPILLEESEIVSDTSESVSCRGKSNVSNCQDSIEISISDVVSRKVGRCPLEVGSVLHIWCVPAARHQPFTPALT